MSRLRLSPLASPRKRASLKPSDVGRFLISPSFLKILVLGMVAVLASVYALYRAARHAHRMPVAPLASDAAGPSSSPSPSNGESEIPAPSLLSE